MIKYAWIILFFAFSCSTTSKPCDVPEITITGPDGRVLKSIELPAILQLVDSINKANLRVADSLHKDEVDSLNLVIYMLREVR